MRSFRAAVPWRIRSMPARATGARRRLPSSAVALTFDDGPDPVSTPAVLDILARHGVPATFFCVGYLAREHPDLVRRIVAEGHAVGSHSETHRVGGLSAAATLADFAAGRRSVEEAVGRPVPLFRPPHGHLSPRVAWALRNASAETWLWTVDPRDYAPGTTTSSALRTLDRCSARDVVLMHDGLEEAEDGAPPRTLLLEYLPAALAGMKDRGITFAALADPHSH